MLFQGLLVLINVVPGFTGSDCSIDESLLPDNLGFPQGDTCDSTSSSCTSVIVDTENIYQSENIGCKLTVLGYLIFIYEHKKWYFGLRSFTYDHIQ